MPHEQRRSTAGKSDPCHAMGKGFNTLPPAPLSASLPSLLLESLLGPFLLTSRFPSRISMSPNPQALRPPRGATSPMSLWSETQRIHRPSRPSPLPTPPTTPTTCPCIISTRSPHHQRPPLASSSLLPGQHTSEDTTRPGPLSSPSIRCPRCSQIKSTAFQKRLSAFS